MPDQVVQGKKHRKKSNTEVSIKLSCLSPLSILERKKKPRAFGCPNGSKRKGRKERLIKMAACSEAHTTYN
jgi:hypothetical protein